MAIALSMFGIAIFLGQQVHHMRAHVHSLLVNGKPRIVVCFLLILQAGLLAFSATCHSPTDLEPAFLVSGISHWQFGRFELYRANPPLVRMVAALPVLAVGCKMDWASFREFPGSRAEFPLREDFFQANGAGTIRLFYYARWACIPFSLIGAYFAYRWARELYGAAAGLITLTLYVFEPNLLAHGELITPDGAATAFGIVAGYTFWRWLKQPSWLRAALAGGALGLAELSKTSWLILFGLWPVLWCVWRWMAASTVQTSDDVASSGSQTHPHSDGDHEAPNEPNSLARPQTGNIWPAKIQLATILLVAVYLINLGYALDGFGTPLRDFQFVSQSLTGLDKPGLTGNRFRDTLVGSFPVPLPRQYVLGIDSQKKDLEDYYLPSYFRGELKRHGGWWYYYLYGLLIKVPCGTWGLLALVVLARIMRRNRPVPLRDELVLVMPAIALFVVVSSQTEFNRHLRYVHPALGLFLIFLGQASYWLSGRLSLMGMLTIALLIESVCNLALVYPHQLTYFNELVGGPSYGYRHLMGSNLDWGQDLLYLREHVQATGQVVMELRNSPINESLARSVIPSFASKSAAGPRIIVVSPNCLEAGVAFPPPSGRPLTPTLWIVDVK